MYLIINTIEDDKFCLGLTDDKGNFIKSVVKHGKYIQAEKILPSIDNLLKPKYNYRQIKGVVVSRGPGGFTSIRIGIITANTFSYALNIPVVGLKADQYKDFADMSKKGAELIKKNKKNRLIVTPFYGREPNITKAKKKKFSF